MPTEGARGPTPVGALPLETVDDLSHAMGTPLTVIVTSLNLLATRLARASRGAPDALPVAMDLNAEAIAASETLLAVLQRIRRQPREGAASATREHILGKEAGVNKMGDRRFERHWAGWQAAVADGATAAYLETAPLGDLVELLASGKASEDARARNVLATAIGNRVARLAAQGGVAPSVIWARLAQSNNRIRTSRELVAQSHALAEMSRGTAPRDGSSAEA